MILTIIIFLVVLSLLVFVHEFGHFYSARKLGVRAEEFGFGFPPRIFGVYKNKEGKWKRIWGRKDPDDSQDTIYSINAVPLGGFVKIKGQDGDNKDPDSFANKKPWRRAIILSSGVIMNVLLASVLISIGLMIGFPQAIDDSLPKSAIVVDEKVQVMEVMENSPAAEAGLRAADIILSINDETVKNEADLSRLIGQSQEENLALSVQRDNNVLDLELNTMINPENGQKIIGIAFYETALVRYPWYQALWQGFKLSFELLGAIFYALYDIVRGFIVGSPTQVEVAGPVGIANLTGQMARMGFVYLLQFTALLSLNLAVINILPFPALDGGRLLFLLFEKIKGRALKPQFEIIFHNIGFLLLIALVIWITFKDVLRIFQ